MAQIYSAHGLDMFETTDICGKWLKYLRNG